MSDLGATVLPWRSIIGRVSPRADLKARRELREAVAEWRPDVLHVSSSKAGVLGTGVLLPPRGVTIFTCHHAPFGPGRKLTHRIIARPVEQFALPRVDGIISDGERDMPALRRLAPKVPIRLVPNAVPAPLTPASTGPLRPRALWVARLQHPKDPFLAVSAWELVVKEIPEGRLAFAGTGPLAKKLEDVIERSPARNSIDFLGYVEDLEPLRAASSLFVLPTRVEGGLTMATLEAMANGLVPVVSDAGDAMQLERTRCGICVRDRGPRAFADALIAILREPERFALLRANAMRYAREQRTPEHLVNETVAFYEETLRRARQNPSR